MEMPTPTAGHRIFERLAGTWEGAETMYPSPWDPQGGTAVGRTVSRVGLGGFVLISDYQQTRGGVATFAGHGVYTFDPKSGLYGMVWFDSVGTSPEHFTGQFADDLLVLSHGGPSMHVRMRCHLAGPDTMRSGMEMSTDGAEWRKLFDGEYHRVG